MNMKSMKYFFGALLFVASTFMATSCTDYNLIDTGVANGDHQTTMWEYFKTDPYNWDSLRVMAERADLVSVFQGTSSYGKDITFFGITNHSIRRYLYANGLKSVADIPVADCKTFILNSILPKRIMLDDFKTGVKSSDASNPIGTGGETFTMASNNPLWIYTFREDYNNVPNAGPLQIYLVSSSTTKTSHVASSNIQTLTGVVHSLDYNFSLKDF